MKNSTIYFVFYPRSNIVEVHEHIDAVILDMNLCNVCGPGPPAPVVTLVSADPST